MPARKPYFCNCVAWHLPELPLLEELIEEGEEITYTQFAARVSRDDLREMEQNLGYGRVGLKMKDDHAVRFKLHEAAGIPFAVHSAIEHVFATEDDIERLRRVVAAKDLEAEPDLAFEIREAADEDLFEELAV